jgi:hypothetical protein
VHVPCVLEKLRRLVLCAAVSRPGLLQLAQGLRMGRGGLGRGGSGENPGGGQEYLDFDSATVETLKILFAQVSECGSSGRGEMIFLGRVQCDLQGRVPDRMRVFSGQEGNYVQQLVIDEVRFPVDGTLIIRAQLRWVVARVLSFHRLVAHWRTVRHPVASPRRTTLLRTSYHQMTRFCIQTLTRRWCA